MTFLLTFFLVLFGMQLLWRAFGPQIARWLLLRVSRNIEEKMKQQHNAFEQNRQGPKEFYVDHNMSAKANTKAKPRTKMSESLQHLERLAEDVDYEDVPA